MLEAVLYRVQAPASPAAAHYCCRCIIPSFCLTNPCLCCMLVLRCAVPMAALQAFQGDPSIRVFLLSVRAGAVGITLTAARLVYLLEPCLNPSLEEQAVGRAWRLGQQHHVTVKRLVVQVRGGGEHCQGVGGCQRRLGGGSLARLWGVCSWC
jgi:hypothetical protein